MAKEINKQKNLQSASLDDEHAKVTGEAIRVKKTRMWFNLMCSGKKERFDCVYMYHTCMYRQG